MSKTVFFDRTIVTVLWIGCLLPALAFAGAGAWKFDFGSGAAAAGYVPVTGDSVYSPEQGYGFLAGAAVRGENRDAADALRGDFCTSDEPFFFTLDAPREGNYRVTVTLGDAEQATDTTIKAESRRLMAEGVRTEPGRFAVCRFTVNIRNSNLPGGGRVRLKDREAGVFHWDNQLTLEFNGPRPCVCALEVEAVEDVVTVFLAGDSTVTDQTREPWTSWGQMLTRFFSPAVAVANYAESGETLRAFAGEKRLEKLLSQMKAGDYLFVQFAHNDMKRGTPEEIGYGESLRQFIREARQRGAHPVLVTSMHRRQFDEAGKVVDTMQGFPEAMRQVAKAEQVPLIDLNAMSKVLYEALGTEGSTAAFVDGTHHNAYGAYQMARCIAEGIKSEAPDLSKHLAADMPTYDPAHPDSPETFKIPASPQQSEVKPEGS